MSEHRVSIPPKIEATIQAAAEEAGKTVSEWIAEAARQKAAGLERTKREKALAEADQNEGYLVALELVEDYEAKYGPIPEEYWREAREIAESMAAGEVDGAHDDAATASQVASQ